MANHTKNSSPSRGAETINFTHHIMAVYGVENVIRAHPGRALFDRAFDAFCPTCRRCSR